MGGRFVLAAAPACAWNHVSAPDSQAPSRSRKFSWPIRCDRVSSE